MISEYNLPISDSQKINLYGLGHSHINTVLFGFNQFIKQHNQCNLEVSMLLEKKFNYYRSKKNKWNYFLSLYFKRQIKKSDIFFCSFGGNSHNSLSLVNHDLPFDFLYSDQKFKKDKFFIPKAIIQDLLYSHHGFKEMLWCIESVNLLSAGKPVYFISSPPPIPSEKYLLDNLEKYIPLEYQNTLKNYGFSPYHLRFKMWLLHTELVKDLCKKNGLYFVEVPQVIFDNSGKLKRKYWNPDGVHASPEYGAKMLQHLIMINNEKIKTSL